VEIFSDTDSDEEDEEDEDELDEEIEDEEEEEYEGELTEEEGSEIDEEVDELGESYISQESMDGLRLSDSNASLTVDGSTQVEEDEDENADDMAAETKLLNSRPLPTAEPIRSA
jgi:phosphatidate phosphatase LPIN